MKRSRFSEEQIIGRIACFEGDAGPLYEIQKTGERRLVEKGTLDRAEVVTNGIGQFPLKKAGAVLWLCAKADCVDPAVYCDHLLTLGAIGQDICYYCAKSGLGVFMTPAVVDARTHEMLGLQAEDDYFVYLFAFGEPAEAVSCQLESADTEAENELHIQLSAETGILISGDGKVRRSPSVGGRP